MFRNDDGSVPGDVPGSFLCPSFYYEASKPPEVYVSVFAQRVFYSFHESFNCFLNSHLFNSCVFGNFVYDICFSHFKNTLIINDLQLPFQFEMQI